MSYLKNPFGIRDGKVLVIGDLDESERGQKCNCRCPHCNGRFIARMGNEKVHHFAHDGAVKNCSDELALLSGLYKLLKQFVDNKNAIPLPQIDLYCNFKNCVGQITKENYHNYVRTNKEVFYNYSITNIVPQKNLVFDCSDIEYDLNKKPIALVLHKGSKRIAIIIRISKKKCKEYCMPKVDMVTEYKDMPTLLLDIFNMDLEETKNTEYFYSIFRDYKKYRWISKSHIIRNLDRINQEKNKYIQEQDRIANERKANEERINNKYFKVQERIYNERKTEKERIKNEQRKKLAEITKKEKEQQRKEEERIKKEREVLIFNTMKRYYKENNLGEPKLDRDGKNNFIVMFREKYGGNERGEYKLGYYEVKILSFTQNDTIITDHWGNRWIKCTACGKVKRDKEFKNRGEENHINEGLCEDCYRQKTYVNLKSIKDMVE